MTQGLQIPLGRWAGGRVQAKQGAVDWSFRFTTLMQKNRNSQHPKGPPPPHPIKKKLQVRNGG